MEVVVAYDELDEIEAASYEMLERRRADIVDGMLDGHHWFIALVADCEALMRRDRVTRFRAQSRI
jgi:hypothetical protein